MNKTEIIIKEENLGNVEQYLRNIYGRPCAWSGGERNITMYFPGVNLVSEKDYFENFSKHYIVVQPFINKDIRSKLIKLARAA